MDLEKIKQYMIKKHGNQLRKQGYPYYFHPMAVANVLKEKQFDEIYQAVALLHDVLEDTDATYEEIVNVSSEEVYNAVLLLTKSKPVI